MTEQEYTSKKEEVLKRFSDQMLSNEKYLRDDTFRTIIEMLIRDADPYEMIWVLIEQRTKIFDEYCRLVELLPPSKVIKP